MAAAQAPERLYRLTPVQERIWLHAQLSPGSAAYNAPVALHVRGPLDAPRLGRALEAVVAANEALNACFVQEDGRVFQRRGPARPARLAQQDLTTLQPGARRAQLHRLLREEVARPFDLARDPLLRATVYALRPGEAVLLLVVHHIVSDGWSQGVLMREIAAAYESAEGASDACGAGKASFFAHADAARRALDAALARAAGAGDARPPAGWLEALYAGAACLAFPYDEPAAGQPQAAGRKKFLRVQALSARAIRELAAQRRATPFIVFLAAVGLLARQQADGRDWRLPVVAGQREDARLFDVLGCFVEHALVRPLADTGLPFAAYLDRILQQWAAALGDPLASVEKLAQAFPQFREALAPSFVLVYQNAAPAVTIRGLEIAPLALQDFAPRFDLTCMVAEEGDAFSVSFEYDTTRYADATVDLLGGELLALLDALTAAPEVPVAQLLRALDARHPPALVRGPERQWPTSSLGTLWRDAVARSADAQALRDGASALSFTGLDAALRAVSDALGAFGGGLRVGVCLPRSIGLVVAVLAVLTRDHCYAALPDEHPDERLSHLLDDSRPDVVVTDRRGEERLRRLRPDVPLLVLEPQSAPGARATVAVRRAGGPLHGVPRPAGARAEGAYLLYTSGSTGQPKGALGTVEGVLNRLHWQWGALPYRPGDRALLRTSTAFVDAIFEMLCPLLSGVGAVIAPPAAGGDVDALCTLLRDERITHLTLVPSLLRALLDAAARAGTPLEALRAVHCSGEPLPGALAARCRQMLPQATLVNLYGATEITADATCDVVQDLSPGMVPIGWPLANTAIAILGEDGELLPRGRRGEIAVLGAAVGAGYHGEPRLTARKFVPGALPGSGARMYLTGDLGRIDAEGRCHYLGRADLQIKVRGMRTSAFEVEEAIRAGGLVRELVVLADATGAAAGGRLAAYYVPADPAVPAERLRRHAESVLPAGAVPSRWIAVARIPLSASGKALRSQALLEHERCAPEPGWAGASALERRVLDIWAEVLGHASFGLHDRFHLVGGHSLLLLRLLDLIDRECGVRVPLAEFLAEPTVAALAVRLARAGAAAPPRAAIVPDPQRRHEPFALLPMQQAYLVGSVEGAGMLTACRFAMDYPELSLAEFESALNRLVARHDMLRAVVEDDGRQRILPEVPRYGIALTDLSALDAAGREDALERMRAALCEQRLPPGRWPSFSVTAARAGETAHRLLFSFDMTFIDLFSARILMRELEQLYRRPHLELAPLALSFRDYVCGVEAARGAAAYAEARAYWLARAADLPGPPQLPPRARAPAARLRFGRRSFRLEPARWRALKARAQAAGVSPTSLLLAVYAATLGHWSAGDAFSLVLTLFNRSPLHPEVDRLVGDFTSSLVFAYAKDGAANAAATVGRVHAQLLADLDHRQFGGVELLREMARARGGEQVLLPVVFTSAIGLPDPGPRQPSLLAGTLAWSTSQTSNVWIDNQVEEDAGALAVNWDTVDERFPAGLVEIMFDSYCAALAALADGAAAWDAPIAPAASTLVEPPPGHCPQDLEHALLYEDFLASAARAPDRLAVVGASGSLSYAELAARGAALCRMLRASGVASGDRVGLLMDKDWDVPVAMLGIALAGAAFVPADPRWPGARIATVLDTAGVELVLTQEALAARVPVGHRALPVAAVPPAQEPDGAAGAARAEAVARPGDVAYIMFTSGTTGSPKGVVIEHASAVATLRAVNRLLGANADDRTLCVSSLCFDLSVYDIWGALSCGAACVMLRDDDADRPWAWPELVARHGVTLWNTVPALMDLLLDAAAHREAELASLRWVLLSGDWIPVSMPGRVARAAPGARLLSLGGATEAAIWSICFPVERVDPEWVSIPYGTALPNQRFHVLDARMRPCPVWAVGELYISGAGLARGYWGDPQRTAAQFVLHPGSGLRLYRTGDLGCRMPDGTIQFLGREDGQVKVNGLRIELEEIESTLRLHPRVRSAVVQLDAHRQLAAHVVLAPAVGCDAGDGDAALLRALRTLLEERLPRYMVPASLQVLDALPLGANGKVDRASLARAARQGAQRERRAGSGDVIVEQVITEIWQVLLGRSQPRRDDNFFACGGDSLVALRFAAKVNAVFNLDLPARALYDHPTLQQLAACVEALREEAGGAPQPLAPVEADLSPARFEPFALTDIQRSYLVGRRADATLGAVAAHSYVEIDYTGLDLARFEHALNALVERHPMLRCVFPDEHRQRVLETVPAYRIRRDSVAGMAPHARDAFLQDKRAGLSRSAYDPAAWPLFTVSATALDAQRLRIHISLDIMIADAWSANVIARDLLALYHGAADALPAPGFGFRDYVLYLAAFQASPRYGRMREYWHRRLPALPAPPPLPVRVNAQAAGASERIAFRRLAAKMDAQRWGCVKERALACGATPSAALLTVFSEVLRLLCGQPAFVVNVTHFNRPPIHPQINNIVGDFASTFLLECRAGGAGASLAERCRDMCRQTLSDLDHSQYSGVRVLNDLSRLHGRAVLAPVVFTSALVLPVNSGAVLGADSVSGEVVYGLTQTPQVWLDHQVYQELDELVLAWDVRDGLFDEALLRAAFDVYVATLERLAEPAFAWTVRDPWLAPDALAACAGRLAQVLADPRYARPGVPARADALLACLRGHPNVQAARAAPHAGSGDETVVRVSLWRDPLAPWTAQAPDDAGAGAGAAAAGLGKLELRLGELAAPPGDASPPALDLGRWVEASAGSYLARQSHRRFWGVRRADTAIDALVADALAGRGGGAAPTAQAPSLARLLSCLAALRQQGWVQPKFRYPSAGSSYGVRAYLRLQAPHAPEGLGAGWYALDPLAPGLRARPNLDAPPLPAPGERAPVLVLARDDARIRPFYGAHADGYAQLEAGAMLELLRQTAAQAGWLIAPLALPEGGTVDGHAVLSALGLQPAAGAAGGPLPAEGIRVRVYSQSAAGCRYRTLAAAAGAPLEEGQAQLAPLAADPRQVLLALQAGPLAAGGLQALGALSQRLMALGPAHGLGFCMLGAAPAGVAAADADGGCATWLVGGPLEPWQQQVPAELDLQAQRLHAAQALQAHARAQGHGAVRVELVAALAQDDAPEAAGRPAGAPPPPDLIEHCVREIWQEVLGVAEMPRDANFFRLGGSSLEALHILRRLHDRYFIELKLHQLMEQPTLDAMAGLIRNDPRRAATMREAHVFLQ